MTINYIILLVCSFSINIFWYYYGRSIGRRQGEKAGYLIAVYAYLEDKDNHYEEFVIQVVEKLKKGSYLMKWHKFDKNDISTWPTLIDDTEELQDEDVVVFGEGITLYCDITGKYCKRCFKRIDGKYDSFM